MPPKKSKSKNKKSTNKNNILKGVGSYSRPKVIPVGPRRLKGRGGYAEDIGGAIGSWLGKKAGGLFKSITGIGEYHVNKNSLLARPSDPPLVTNTASATRIQHREYIQDIFGTTDWTNLSFSINPGMSETFPWLSTVANAFEQYRFHGILFQFKSTSADALNSTNTALGTVIMATEYNPLHDSFASKRDMENHVYSTSCAPSTTALHPIECARDVTVLDELFVRNVPVEGSDLRFSDIGKFQIATVGMQASANIGELWVTYDIELLKPKLPDAFTSVGPAHYAYSTTSPIVPNPNQGTPTTANIFGASGNLLGLMGTGVSPVDLSTNTVTFKATGRYILMWSIQGSHTAGTFAATLGASVTASGIFHNSGLTSQVYAPVYPTPGSTAVMLMAINVNALEHPTVTFTDVVMPASPAGIDFFVIPLPAGFSSLKSRDVTTLILDRLENIRLKLEDDEKEHGLHHEPSLSRESSTTVVSSPVLSRSTLDLASLIKGLSTKKN